jgi:hypothetical protein
VPLVASKCCLPSLPSSERNQVKAYQGCPVADIRSLAHGNAHERGTIVHSIDLAEAFETIR